MSVLPDPLRIVGYASELSVRPGEHLTFQVSSELGGEYAATVHRLLGGGSDPRAPRLRTEQVAALGRFPALDQPVPIGSRAVATWPAAIEAAEATFTIEVQRRLAGTPQAIAWLGGQDGLGIELDETGSPRVLLAGATIATADAPLELRTWTRLVVAWSAAGIELSWGTGDAWRTVRGIAPTPIAGIHSLALAARPLGDGWDRHFTGRLERPVLLAGRLDAAAAAAAAGVSGEPIPATAIAGWDFSREIGAWTVRAEGTEPTELALRQAPVRGVRGARWTDATDYRDAPAQYGAIHFHADSLEDCEWLPQAEWTVPDDASSGFYALHVDAGGEEDWIPFFVRPALGRPAAELLVVASTATYYAYGNSRFWWEDPIQEIAQDRLVELGRQEQYLVTHPELGLANYDRHLDDSPVNFSSRHRPNLFMRPGHSRAEAYASDLYLIAWLERRGIAYDVVTDEDVHFDGRALMDPYRAIVSGSHPEYLSDAMYDATRAWVEAGGRYCYLGGNGYISNVTWRSDRPWLMENRATGNLQNDPETVATEGVNQLDGTIGRRMSETGRSPGSLWGVDSVTMGFDRSYPVLRSDTSYAPEFAWAFDGIVPRLFAGRSLSGGGVIGQEWDNARLMLGAPGHYVLASSIDHSLIPTVLGADPIHHGDVVAFFHDRGLVVSASAMAWVGALHVDDYENDAERFVRNVITRFLDPAPIAQPSAAEAHA